MKHKHGIQWIKHPFWATLLTMASLLFAAIGGGVFSLLVFGNADEYGDLGYLGSASSITVIALIIVYFLRKLGGQSWSGLQMHIKWTSLLEIITGFVLAFLTIFISDVVSVLLGSAAWHWDSRMTVSVFSISVLGILISQAFPEDLLFRGHLFDTLSHKVSPRMDVLITSVAFGSLHILSQGGAGGFGEQLMFAVYATSFGFVLAACRLVRGSLWLPVGFHAGNDQFLGFFVSFDDGIYIMHFIIVTVFMSLTGWALLTMRRTQSKS